MTIDDFVGKYEGKETGPLTSAVVIEYAINTDSLLKQTEILERSVLESICDVLEN